MKRWIWIAAAVGFVAVVVVAYLIDTRNDGSMSAPPVVEKPPKVEGPVRFVTVEPIYVAPKGDEKEAALINAAMRAVYSHCAGFSIRDGATFEGTYVFPSKKVKAERVNVSMKLADETKSNGHVLWYMVTFDDDGKPKLIRAVKDVSAELCGFAEPEVDEPVRL